MPVSKLMLALYLPIALSNIHSSSNQSLMAAEDAAIGLPDI
jgi:hypothetical protein